MNTNLNQTDSIEVPSMVSSNQFFSTSDLSNNDTKSTRRFTCSICNIDLINQKQFNSHLNSRQHQQAQSIHDVLQSVSPECRSTYKAMFSSEMLNKKVFNRELQCEEKLKLIKEPLLGLNYIIEFQFENLTDPPQYICELCHCKCSLSSMLSHIINLRHQKKFFKTHHPDMYERILSASNIRSEQQRLIENYAKQIQSRHGGPGHIQLHIQLDLFIGQKPIVLSVTFKSQSSQNSKGQKKLSIQLTSKTFEEYDYTYEDEPNKGNEEFVSEPIVNNHEDSIQHGLSPEDLLYPFDRQFWYQNYKDLLESRPIDPHSVTYKEIIPETNNLQPFQGITEKPHSSSTSIDSNENPLTLENDQTIRRNTSQPSNRRVILDTNRTPTINNNGILRISPTKNRPNFDGYTLLNEQQKKTNGTNAVLNEKSARAILAASGLLQSDEEDDEYKIDVKNQSSIKTRNDLNKKSDQIVSPLIAKRMLDAVLNGDLDVVHIQPYFSTFVNLIQSGQVELERHQAERLLHKVLVTSSSSPTIKTEPITNSNKRTRSDSHSREHHHSSSSSSTTRHVHHNSGDYRSSTESNGKKYSSSSSSSSTRRVHLMNEYKPTNRE